MSAPSPVKDGAMLADFLITADGQAINDSWPVLRIETWSEVNRIPKARLILADGAAANGKFPASDAAAFVPGAEVEISLGYDGEKTPVFKGLVLRHAIEITPEATPRLVVEVADKAVAMTVGRKTAVFRDLSDSDLIGKLIGAAGLQKEVGATTGTHKEIIQYWATDWDMLLSRADVNGLLVTVESGKVTAKAPEASGQPVLRVAFGEDLLSLDAELDAGRQVAAGSVNSLAWDYAKQAVAQSGPGSVAAPEAGNLGSDKLAQVLNAVATQQSAAALDKDALQAWSSSALLRAKLSRLRGRARFVGSELAKPGKLLELAGLGERFNGAVLITGVGHCLENGLWTTTAGFGLGAPWFAETAAPIAAPPAAGQLPPITGLHTGIVKQVHEDPDGQHRVKVTLPLITADSQGVWARLGGVYASKQFGAVVFPEVGDEVLLGFMNDDPRAPVILGSVYSKDRAPAYPADADNTKKAIVTRSKMEILFDEKDKIITVKTPGGHSLTLDDKAKSVTVKDSNDNSMTLSDQGVTVKSAKDMTLQAEGDVTVKAGGKLFLAAQSDASLKALNIAAKSDADSKIEAGAGLSLKATGTAALEGLQTTVKAQVALSAEGGASAELKGGGMLSISGALVKIN